MLPAARLLLARLSGARFPRFAACGAASLWVSSLAAPAAFAQQSPPPNAGTVTTAADETDADSALSFREALIEVHAGGPGIRFDVSAFADPNVDPLIELNGAIPAGREDVRVELEQGGRGIELLVKPGGNGTGAAGPFVFDPTFTGAGTITADLGSGSAAELTLNGQNGHRLTRVVTGTVVAGSDTGFGRGLHLDAAGAGRLVGDTYLGQLTGDGTLNLGSHRLVLGVFPSEPGAAAPAADGPGYSSAFAGTLAGTADAGVMKIGLGTSTLTGTNSYGGGTALLGGRLEVGSAAALGTGDLQLGNGAELRLLGLLDDRPGHAAGPAFLRRIELADVGGAIDLNGHDLLLGGGIGGAGGLTAFGGATLTLATTNTHAGGTAVHDSTLVLAADGALGTGDLYLNDAAVRTAHTGGQVTYAGAILLGTDGGTVETTGGDWAVRGGLAGGALTKVGDGELRLLAPGSHASTAVTGGTLAVTGLSALGEGRLTLDGGTLFAPLADGQQSVLANAVAIGAAGGTIRTGDELTLSGRLTGDGLLTKTGGGTLILNGRNAATGGVRVSGGTLRADRQAALGAGPLTLDGGTFATAGTVTLGGSYFDTAAAGGTLRHLAADARTTLAGDLDLRGDLALTGGGTVVFAPDILSAAPGVGVSAAGGTAVRVDTAAPTLDLAADTRLTGAGQVVGHVTSAGRVAPGADGAGGQVLTVHGDLTLEPGGDLAIDFSRDGADAVAVGGAADLAGATVTVNVGAGDAADRRAMAASLARPGATATLTVLSADGGVTAGPRAVRSSSWAMAGSVADHTHVGTASEPLRVRLTRIENGAVAFADANDAAAADALFALMPAAEGPAADLFAAALLTDAAGAAPVLRGLTAARAGGLGGVSTAGAGAVRRTAFRALRPGSAGGGLFRGQSDDLPAGSLAGANGAGTNGGGTNDEFGFGSFGLATDLDDGAELLGSPVRTADAGDGDLGSSDSGLKQSSFTPGGRTAGSTANRSRRAGNGLPWGGFAEGYVVGGEAGAGTNETDYLTGGAVFGVDRLVAPGTRAGLLFGFGGTGSDSAGAADRFESDVDSWQIGLYGTKTAGRWHAAAAAVYGSDSYETVRTVRTAGQDFTANGETDGSTVTLAAEGGYLLPIDWIDLQPLAGVQYVHASRDGYRETGLGAADLLYGDADASSLRVQLGGRAAKTFGDVGSFAVIPELRAWWFGEVAGEDSPAPVRFAAAPTLPAFTTVGDDPVNQWVLGGGLTSLLGKHVRLYAHYDLLLGEDALSHAGTGGAELRW